MKSEKVRTSLLFAFSLLLFTSAARAATIDVTSGNFESYRALKDGNTYRFAESVTFAAPATESAMAVAEGATVTLNIAAGVTVTLTGGSANGGSGGAGIGGGFEGAGGEVTINGGTVTATGGVWVVTPNAGVTEITIAWLPEGAFVAVPPTVTRVNGVDDGQIRVKSGAYDITGAFSITDGAIALNPNGAVTIGGERIPVKPVIGELGCFDGEPFAVGENGASITIRTIPGLFYGLRKGSSLSDGEFAVLVWTRAERTNLSFTDKSLPELAAFYDIEVRTYVEEPIQSDGGLEVGSEIDPETLTIVGFDVDAANKRVLLRVSAETTANVDAAVARLLNVTVRKGAEVTVRVERAESPGGPWTVLPGVGGMVTIDRAGADIEVKLDGELPAQGYFRVRIVE